VSIEAGGRSGKKKKKLALEKKKTWGSSIVGRIKTVISLTSKASASSRTPLVPRGISGEGRRKRSKERCCRKEKPSSG